MKSCREKGIDPMSIDWAHELDWMLSYAELKRQIARRLAVGETVKPSEVEEYMRYMEMVERVPVEMEFSPLEVEQMLREMEPVYV